MAENHGRPLAENEPTPESVNVNEAVQTGSPIATEHEATGFEQRDSSANDSTEERLHEQTQPDIESDESSGLSDDAKESLRTAIEKGDHGEVVRMIARKGAMDTELAYDLPDFMDSKLVTPLMFAIICGQPTVVELLLKLKAEVNTSTAGWRALDFAFLHDQPAIAEALLRNGADIGVRNTFIDRTALHWAADKGFLGCVRLLLKNKADVNIANHIHVTPLHLAILNGHMKIVEILLESGANIEAVDNNERNCLHYACRINQTGIVKLLLEKGANKSHILNGIDKHGCTPLQIAGHSDTGIDIVELLLQEPGIEVAIRDADGDTPLSQAAWDKNHEVMLRLLTSAKYFPNDPVRSQACLSTSLEAERILPVLREIVDDQLWKTYDQFEAIIFWTISNGHVEFLRESCLAGRELKPLTRKVGDTTWLHIAAKYGQEQMIRYLWHEGFELENVAVDGITAFHLVAENGNSKAAEILCGVIYRKHDCLLRLAQLIIQKDDQGKSPLSLCVRGHHKDTARLFWRMLSLFVSEHGSHDSRIFEAHPNEANQLLELAAELGEPGNEKFLAILFDAWFDPPKEDAEGWTVLHLAVYHRQVVPVWWLLSNGSHLGSKEMQRAKGICRSRREGEEDDAKRNNKRSEENEENKQLRILIAEMLHSPPPIASHMDQDDEGFPNPPRISHDVLRPNVLEGAIIDVHRKEGQDKLDLQFKQEDLSTIIYDSGPGEIMSTARKTDWRDRHSLKENIKERLNKNAKKSALGTHLTSDKDSQRQPSILTEDKVSAKKHPKKTTEDEKSAKHPDSLAYRWIHIPTNDMRLVKDLVTCVSLEAGKKNKHLRPITKFLEESWIELAAGNNKRYMRPMCTHQPTGPSKSWPEKGESNTRYKSTETDTGHRQSEDRKEDSPAVKNMSSTPKRKQIKEQGATALYMPYLTLGELREGDTRNIPSDIPIYDGNALNELMKALESGAGGYKYDGPLKGRESGAGSTFIEQGPHEEMTLDQFYYSTLSETETRSRDNDQVLSRYLSPADGNQTRERKILVVHQLWLFVIDEKTMISATTQPSLQSGDVIIEGVWEHLVSRRTDGDIDSVIELILSVATGLFTKEMVSVNATEGGSVMKGALDVFRESIRHVAHQEAERFQRFTDYLDEGKNREQDERKHSEENKTENPFRDVSPETKLLREIKDICDELNILKALAEAQVDVWKEALQVDHLKDFKSKHSRLCKPTAVKKAIESMIQDAHIARDSLGVLLDLIHKQASINEAESGQKQAMDAAKQSSTTMVFTLVTAVFLPLSFFTSFFAMNVTEFPHNGDNVQYEGKWIFPIIFLGSLGVTMISILVAFNFDYLGKLGNLPKDIKRWLRLTPDIQNFTPGMQRLISPEVMRKKVEELRQLRNKPHDEEKGG